MSLSSILDKMGDENLNDKGFFIEWMTVLIHKEDV
jgi:hypothetical protein